MARPKTKLNQRTQEAIREKIKAGELIKFLQNHAIEGGELDNSRVDAAKFLLSRIVSPPVPKDDAGNTQKGPLVLTWQQ